MWSCRDLQKQRGGLNTENSGTEAAQFFLFLVRHLKPSLPSITMGDQSQSSQQGKEMTRQTKTNLRKLRKLHSGGDGPCRTAVTFQILVGRRRAVVGSVSESLARRASDNFRRVTVIGTTIRRPSVSAPPHHLRSWPPHMAADSLMQVAARKVSMDRRIVPTRFQPNRFVEWESRAQWPLWGRAYGEQMGSHGRLWKKIIIPSAAWFCKVDFSHLVSVCLEVCLSVCSVLFLLLMPYGAVHILSSVVTLQCDTAER